MATDPKFIMSSRSLAGQQAGQPRGELQEPLGPAAMAFPSVNPPPEPSLFRHRASGFWISCIDVLALLTVGLATPPCPQSDPDDICIRRSQCMLGEQRGDDPAGFLPIAGAIEAFVRGYVGVSTER